MIKLCMRYRGLVFANIIVVIYKFLLVFIIVVGVKLDIINGHSV